MKYAQECGLLISRAKKPRYRSSYRRVYGFPKLSVLQLTSAKKLIKERARRIANKEVDVGERVVPVQFTRNRISPAGIVEKQSYKVYGRRFLLRKLSEDHLKQMSSLGLLRQRAYDKLSESEIDVLLDSYGEFQHLGFN